MKTWQLQEAKAQFSKVVRKAIEHEPQEITLHGKIAVVVVSKKDYDQLQKPKPSFVEFMRRSPLCDVELDIERDKSNTRNVDL